MVPLVGDTGVIGVTGVTGVIGVTVPFVGVVGVGPTGVVLFLDGVTGYGALAAPPKPPNKKISPIMSPSKTRTPRRIHNHEGHPPFLVFFFFSTTGAGTIGWIYSLISNLG